MEIRCPNCGQSYDVEHDMEGRAVKCPVCGDTFDAHNALLTTCRICGKAVSRNAEACPNCGERMSPNQILRKTQHKSGCWKWGCIVLVVVFVSLAHLVGVFMSRPPASSPTPNPVLAERLSYLTEIEGLSWALIRNDVYMSWRGNVLPHDYKVIANAAAVNGSLALVERGEVLTRCSVFVIPEQHNPGDVSKCFYNVNARKGILEK